MTCPRCQRAARNVFPGGTVHCTCGETFVVTVETAPVASAFRAPAVREERTSDVPTILCPYCGTACAGNARACPTCEVSFDGARCRGCRTLRPPFETWCGRCGLKDATPLAGGCPRCNVELDPLRDSPGLRACIRCGGLFASHITLAEHVARAESGTVARIDVVGDAAIEPTAYARCPDCSDFMGRVGFARASGVIVDVCAAHGTWFDRNELTQGLRFLAEHPGARAAPRTQRSPAHDSYRARESGKLAGREAFEALRIQARHAGTESLLVDLLFIALG